MLYGNPYPHRALTLALALCLGACGSDGGDTPATPAAITTGSLTVKPSLGLVQNADVILTQLGSATPFATLNTGSSGAVTFNNIPGNLGAYTLELRAGPSSTYFDEALSAHVAFTGSLHMAGSYASNSSVGVTALTEAAYQRALALGATLTAANIAAANTALSQQFGINITTAPSIVGSSADLAALQSNAADAYALVLAAIASASQSALGAGDSTPALTAAQALAADAADGKIDGLINGSSAGLPATLPYSVSGGYATQLQSAIAGLVTSLSLPSGIAGLVTPVDPVTPEDPDPVDPGTPGSTATASGSISTTNASSADFSPRSDGFSVEVTAEAITYTFTATSSGGNHDISVKTDLGGNIKALTYRDGSRLGLYKSLICGSDYAKPCTGVSLTPAPASKTFTLGFTDAVLTLRDLVTVTAETSTFNGSVTGSLPAGYAFSTADLPRSTDGILNINGSNETILSTSVSVSTSTIPSGLYTVTSIVMRTQSGALTLTRDTTTPSSGTASTTNILSLLRSGISYNCDPCTSALSVSKSGDFLHISLTDAVMKPILGGSDLTLNNTIIIGSTSGTLASTDSGNFSPVQSSIYSKGDALSYRFHAASNISGNSINTVTVTFKQGTSTVTEISVQGSKLYSCFEQAQPLLGTPACGGSVTISPDRRTLTLNNISLNSGTYNGNNALSITSATLTNQGL